MRPAHARIVPPEHPARVMRRPAKPDVVVVTGASAGVGRATARAFGARGALVGLLARGRDGLEVARAEIEAAGGHAIVLVADVSREDDVEAAAGQVEQTFGPIDVWVNNAMVSVSRCSRPTARPSTPCRASTTRCAASCSTTTAR